MALVRRSLCAILLVAGLACPAFAQSGDPLDDLLSIPDSTDAGSGQDDPLLPADSDQSPLDPAQLASHTSKPLRFGVSAMAAALAGLNEWDVSEGWGSLSGDLGLEIAPRIAVDLRPETWLRFYLEVSSHIDVQEVDFAPPQIDEAFIDYTVDNAAIRVGKQRLGWGQSVAMLSAPNPGNLIAGIADGISLKLFLPFLGNGVTALVYTDQPDPASFAYALALETSGELLSFGLAARYGWELGLATSSYLKLAVGGLDLALELRGDFDINAGLGAKPVDASAFPRLQGMLGVFGEIPQAGVQMLGQYSIDMGPDLGPAHMLAVGLRFTKILSHGWTPLLRLRQSLDDGSGEFILALEGPFLPSTRARIGIPVAWGLPNSFYRENGEDPSGRVLSLGLQVSLDFEMDSF